MAMIRAGCWQEYDEESDQAIISLAARAPVCVFYEDKKHLVYCDVAYMHLGDGS